MARVAMFWFSAWEESFPPTPQSGTGIEESTEGRYKRVSEWQIGDTRVGNRDHFSQIKFLSDPLGAPQTTVRNLGAIDFVYDVRIAIGFL